MSCITNINLSCDTFKSCGDVGVNIDSLVTTDFSALTTSNKYQSILNTELIDVKSRKTIQSYPTLKALYNRYKYTNNPKSGAYDYLKMNQFSELVGDYWIDLIEQVIPSTAIWGSTHTNGNTIFDSQKFQYKKYSLLTCGSPNNVMYPSPTSGLTNNVGVEVYTLIKEDPTQPNCLVPEPEMDTCSSVYIQQVNMGSEFIGSVSIIGDTSDNVTSGDTITITECDLVINNIRGRIIGGGLIEYDPSYIGGTTPYNFDWEILNSSGVYSDVGFVDGINNIENVIMSGFTEGIGELSISLTMNDTNDCTAIKTLTINT